MPGGPRQHVVALDGLRGLASAIVVVTHTVGAMEIPEPIGRALLASPLALVLNAQGAVQLFFVLSGFVLAGSLARHRAPVDLAQFYVKRIFRIHPPYLGALLFAWCASFFYWLPEEQTGLTSWIKVLAGVHIGIPALLVSASFPGGAYGQLPVGWTLSVEMAYSFLLPLMVFVARRSHGVLLLVIPAFLFAAGSRSVYVMYSTDFALGIIAFMERERLSHWIDRLSPPAAAAGVLISLALFAAPRVLAWQVPARGDPASIAIMGAGSFGLLVFGAFLPVAARALATRPMVFLGRISYSLYLLHTTVLILAAHTVDAPLSLLGALLLLSAVMGISLLLSACFYSLVERPSIAAGNRICLWLARRAHTHPLESHLAA